MKNEEIEKLALENGFKLKHQPSGEMGLNPYVYEFSHALLAESMPSAKIKALIADANIHALEADGKGDTEFSKYLRFTAKFAEMYL